MIISRTPFRVSFFGGGTDYHPWYQEHGGAVLAATIDKYCYISCRPLPPFFEHKSRVVWSEIELVSEHRDIRHPVIRAGLEHARIKCGIEIHHNSDLPARAGLGSSSSFTVGLLNGLHALQGDPINKKRLAEEAIFIEREVLKENVGVQDQIETAFGGFNRVDIGTDGSFEVTPINLPDWRMSELESHLLLVFSGVSRSASAIAAEQMASIKDKQTELHIMRQLVDAGMEALMGSNPLKYFGELLHETWMLKRGLSRSIAPAFVDEIYEAARKAGAVGGKLLGAGGGGFLLFFVPPERRLAVSEALKDLVQVPFGFDHSGACLIYNSSN